MNIKINHLSHCVYLAIAGRLDAITSVEAEQTLRSPLKDSPPLIIDMAEVAYISSAGLRLLLILAKQYQANKAQMVLCRLQSSVLEVFKISGFSSIFRLVATGEEAEAVLNE